MVGFPIQRAGSRRVMRGWGVVETGSGSDSGVVVDSTGGDSVGAPGATGGVGGSMIDSGTDYVTGSSASTSGEVGVDSWRAGGGKPSSKKIMSLQLDDLPDKEAHRSRVVEFL